MGFRACEERPCEAAEPVFPFDQTVKAWSVCRRNVNPSFPMRRGQGQLRTHGNAPLRGNQRLQSCLQAVDGRDTNAGWTAPDLKTRAERKTPDGAAQIVLEKEASDGPL